MTAVPRTFEPVNDLGCAYERARASTGETFEQFVERNWRYRRGILAAAAIFDQFTDVVAKTMQDPGHPEITHLDSLERYAAYVKFRFEFTKRMYEPQYGIGVDPHPPVAGTIHVLSVDPTGVARKYGKLLGQSRVMT